MEEKRKLDVLERGCFICISMQWYLISTYSISVSQKTPFGPVFGFIHFKCDYFRKRKDWDVYEPIVDLLSNEEVDALEAREEKIAR